ncbi:unnamed protein product [Alternaria alternata]
MLSALALHSHYGDQEHPAKPRFENWPDGVVISPLYDDFKKNSVKILSSILSDRWFTRAWTFQEKLANEAKGKLTVDSTKIALSKLDLDQNVEWYLDGKIWSLDGKATK